MTVDTDREARLEEIRERLDAATDGPWTFDPGNEVFGPRVVYYKAGYGVCEAVKRDDAVFIAHAPEDIDWLRSEVDRLREIEEAARDVADAFGPKVWRDATVGRAGVYSGDAEDAETVERLEAKLEGEDG